ncbi:MAG: heme o synthase [Limisphaerales bacterium]
MRVFVQALSAAVSCEGSLAGNLSELFKLRLTTLVLLTTLAGYHLGRSGPLDWTLLALTLAGTALVAAGAAALNQWLEREHDARMPRTASRPLPAGRMEPDAALAIGVVTSGIGILLLGWFVNGLTAALGALALVSYVAVYTPLKRVTTWNTLVGAVPGALPPLMGWTAARDSADLAGWVLFAILFLWQVPHFFAIAWLYREQYAAAGFRMLPVADPAGRRTGNQSVGFAAALLVIAALPTWLGVTGAVYLAGSLALGVLFLAAAVSFRLRLDGPSARRLFFASILYLPVLLSLMAVDKT